MLKKFFYVFLIFFYICFLLIVFAHLLFPGEKGALFLSEKLKKHYKVDFRAEIVKPEFPFKLEIKNLELSSGQIKNLKIDQVKISPSILNLLIGKLKLKINAQVFGGRIDSEIKLSLFKIKEDFSFDSVFENISLKETQPLLGNDFAILGQANGRVKLDYSDKKGNLSSIINLQNFDLVSKLLLVPVSVFEINRAEIKGKIEDKDLLLEDSILRSKVGFSSFTGRLSRIDKIQRSRADIDGKFVPDPEYILKNKDNPSMALILPIVKNKKNIEFTIKGNLLNPMVRFK
ncbi:MAG: type II secretion system protein GspN [Desulforegulaceae bacterium]|nr:type II secretion system protein GspN [Desulforegulaceae bacterium]